MHSNWRDSQEWNKEGFKFNTRSNEACKLYDATLTQYIGWYDLPELGGISGTMHKMLEADPSFIMARVIELGISYISNPSGNYGAKIGDLNHLKLKLYSELTNEEILHIDALNHLTQGKLTSACDLWELILLSKPTDMLAIKFLHDIYFYIGYQRQMRDSVARVLPLWNATLPLYGYLYGMYSFGLTQTNLFTEAKKVALRGLELNPYDGWSTHSICHLNEYSNAVDDGIKFLHDTELFWSKCDSLASHNYWHLCLHYLEKNEHHHALSIYDDHIYPSAKRSHSYLDIVDATELLYRLKLDSTPLSLDTRLSQVANICSSHLDNHSFPFNDIHIFMGLSHGNNIELKTQFTSSLMKYLEFDDEHSTNQLKDLYHRVGINLIQAVDLFNNGKHEQVVEILYPIRYEIISIGGSNAQRDLFNQILIHACLQSGSKLHQKLGVALLNERLALKPSSNLTKRLSDRFLSNHFITHE